MNDVLFGVDKTVSGATVTSFSDAHKQAGRHDENVGGGKFCSESAGAVTTNAEAAFPISVFYTTGLRQPTQILASTFFSGKSRVID